MMDALEAILTRRSIRKYTGEPISAEVETLLLKAAMNAQNTVNNRDWAFVVIRDPARLNTLADCLKPNGEPLRKTTLAIAVCGDLSLTLKGLEGYWVQDCAAAATNILLAAHASGLGAVWYGTYPQEHKVRGVREALALPEHIIPMCILGMGYPAESKPAESELRYEQHKIHYEAWQSASDETSELSASSVK